MLREAGPEDWEAVYGLICHMEQTALDRAAFQAIYLAQRQSESYLCLLCQEAGRVTGCLNLRLEPQLHHAAPVAEILELAVAEGCRGRGLGKALLDEACRRARDRGCVQIEVCCNLLREGAHRFYEREGLQAFHFKRSRSLTEDGPRENRLGR